MNWTLHTGFTVPSTALAFAISIAFVPPASAAEWACEYSEPITGGMLHLLISGSQSTPLAVQGAVELSTNNVAPPLGLRDGTFPWDASQAAIAASGAIFSLNFDVTLPLSETPNWGAASGSLVPSQLNFLLPALRNPTGAPVQLASVTVITGNGIYSSNNEWRIRTGDGAILITNTPEPLSLMYSRELLQIISNDPNEPISLFLTPAIPASLDSIVSFHAGGIIEAPGRTNQLIQDFIASDSSCPTTGTWPNAVPATEEQEP
jgi:hypothetical protein